MPLGIRVVDQIVDQADFQLLASLAAGDVLRFSGSKWRNYSASGATLPTSPIVGQIFLHTPTGRSNLMIYDGSSWQPLVSIGTWTIYVDGTNGTDNQNNGWGTGSNAFKTITYAMEQVASDYAGNIVVNIAAGTYSETVNIKGKNPTGNFTITLRGTMTVVESVTATGGTQGSTSSFGTVTKSTSWGSYINKWLLGTSGSNNNVYRIIDNISGTTATIVGYWSGTPSSGDTFDVVQPGTIVNQINCQDGQQNIIIENIEFAYPDTTITSMCGAGSACTLRRCLISFSSGSSISVGAFGTITAEETFSYKCRFFLSNSAAMTIRGCKFMRAQAAAGATARTVQCWLASTANFASRPSVLDGDGTGVIGLYCASGANATFNSLYCVVRNYNSGGTGTGVLAETTGSATEMSNAQYNNNYTNYNAIASTYGVYS